MSPERRRRWAWYLLIASTVGMVANVAVYLLKWIDEDMLLLITLILSWVAIQIGAVEVLATTDVRAEQDS